MDPRTHAASGPCRQAASALRTTTDCQSACVAAVVLTRLSALSNPSSTRALRQARESQLYLLYKPAIILYLSVTYAIHAIDTCELSGKNWRPLHTRRRSGRTAHQSVWWDPGKANGPPRNHVGCSASSLSGAASDIGPCRCGTGNSSGRLGTCRQGQSATATRDRPLTSALRVGLPASPVEQLSARRPLS